MARISGIKKLKNYNLAMLINNAVSKIYTILFWRGARLVRYPIRVYGKYAISYQPGLTIGNFSKIDIATDGDGKKLVIGKDCIFGDMLHIAANKKIVIGDNVLTGSRVFITDTNHGRYKGENQSKPDTHPDKRELDCKETVIGSNVWIGENVSILAGSRIGDGCVIASNAVVSGEVSPMTIDGGVPSKIIKEFNSENWIRRKK